MFVLFGVLLMAVVAVSKAAMSFALVSTVLIVLTAIPVALMFTWCCRIVVLRFVNWKWAERAVNTPRWLMQPMTTVEGMFSEILKSLDAVKALMRGPKKGGPSWAADKPE